MRNGNFYGQPSRHIRAYDSYFYFDQYVEDCYWDPFMGDWCNPPILWYVVGYDVPAQVHHDWFEFSTSIHRVGCRDLEDAEAAAWIELGMHYRLGQYANAGNVTGGFCHITGEGKYNDGLMPEKWFWP